ncbi:DNA polymerase III subunit delta' [Legionella moravica]|uniref:DNA-directed DNA polymerase n=1 Tax=Legionella moravica TaxID=39962 RepID=A0A378JW77_9GAMM|nr:DNA polymerase III subunit delta' [Legionella moravica]KTD34211.1 DNA polymerase III subunit delta' [Legionella moravica]STX62913.1 DNA polymerase III, delta prime subunit [Legionella moravica]
MNHNHQEQWQKIQSAFVHQRVPQSMLLVGPLHCDLGLFVKMTTSLLLCKSGQNEPCLCCSDCQMVERMEHPDVEWIKPEKTGGAIKVDQIRELQSSAYLTPQRSGYRLIVIESADRMNTASANALLKILEEPTQHTVFVLIAQQLSTVLPTVLSRCQIITFSMADDSAANNLLMLGKHYTPESERAQLLQQADVILDGLIALIERKQHPCVLAAQWTQFELGSFLWFLYLVFSQIQNMHVLKMTVTGPAALQLDKLLTLLTPISIFTQIDKINTLLRKISHNMNVNHTLVLEDLLFSLIPGT